MRFAYKYQYFNICHSRYHHFFNYIIAKYGAKFGLLNIVNFDDIELDYEKAEQEMLTHQHLIVEGWYARWYDLFLKYKEDIIRLFAFNEEIENSVGKLMDNSLRLGIHIRRGDYRTFQGGRFFYTDEQYVHIIRSFLAFHFNEKVHVYICGNDPSLNKEYYTLQLSTCQVSLPQGTPGEDLCLLSHCDYLIGAPSTFSLVASMYHNLPLYWIEDPTIELSQDSFKYFDYLFKHIY
jgi:hypothetical protein